MTGAWDGDDTSSSEVARVSTVKQVSLACPLVRQRGERSEDVVPGPSTGASAPAAMRTVVHTAREQADQSQERRTGIWERGGEEVLRQSKMCLLATMQSSAGPTTLTLREPTLDINSATSSLIQVARKLTSRGAPSECLVACRKDAKVRVGRRKIQALVRPPIRIPEESPAMKEGSTLPPQYTGQLKP